ncbi:MAG: adenylate kinase [Candidatus Aenigmarchaeota archaeon]|nr:adenylate kinase [Candidatus Aenigmarchaeota archaeon]
MKIVLLGPPGSGKGTQASMLSEKYGLPHISMGDLLREEVKNNTDIGKKMKEIMNAGKLVPDELTVGILKQRLSKGDSSKGVVLDGFPRNTRQAEMLNEKFDAAILLELDDRIAIERMSKRRQCRDCGKIYSEGRKKCGACGGELYQRDDDKPAAMEKRLEIYHTETKPLIDYYKKKKILKTIDAMRAVDVVFSDIQKALG